MREIKFRLVGFVGVEKKILGYETWNNHLRIWEYSYNKPFLIFGREIEPDLREKQQYTGLKDCNGKEVYEGDILRAKVCTFENNWEEAIGWVKFDNASFYFINNKINLISLKETLLSMTEIIGNIFENPELLETKTNA